MCIFAEMQQRWVMQKLIGVTALSSKAVTAGLTEQHWCSWHEQVSQASVMCIFAEMQQRWVMQKLKGVTALSSKAVYSWPLRSSTGAVGMNRFPRLQ